MTLSYDFLISRADESADVAASKTLDNVRDIALRSEAALREMAKRIDAAVTAVSKRKNAK